jgi:hypothetical protein
MSEYVNQFGVPEKPKRTKKIVLIIATLVILAVVIRLLL